ncbi:phosphotransferase family protein [Falsibacillus albus]|uniref:Aminoglycoside phosphotransferase family protein n=1 Tax=Falsibacillus albus TaxID=2478915 RepID=A0A3L7JRH1_9BACI|nr:aminoglycoside phosphotransferase family protein [Falsibacillus albus]RLQ92291.1 aminoglycoside phosphotransferase family protein [Falsibacillus albus]
MNLGDPIGIGNTAKIYLHNNRIFKIYNDHLPETEASYEAAKQEYAYSCGLPVPKVLDVATFEGKHALIMEYVNGRTFGDLAFENSERAAHLMELSVDIQLQIHAIKADSLEPMSDRLRRQLQSVTQLDDSQKSRLLQKLDAMTFENRLCHGDFHLYNLIASDDRVTIIDWVDASAGDLRADVYRSYLLYTQVSEELAELYLQLYCEKSGISKEDIFQWAPIIAAARLSEHVPTESEERLLEIVQQYGC